MSRAEDDAVAMSEDSSDSDSDFEEIEASEEDMQAISGLEAELQANPNLYDKHIEYIGLLRKCKMKARLAMARRAMHSKFPLSEDLWMQWLDDEIQTSGAAERTNSIEELFGMAVQDYLSISIWIKYLTYLADHNSEVKEGSAKGREKMRDVYEAALSAGGIHVSQGSQLWKLCRKYEMEHSSGLEKTDPQNTALKLFHRQLQVPLADNVETLEELQEFCEKNDTSAMLPDQVKKGQAKAENMARARRSYEESVALTRPADTELLANFMAYIKLEEASGEPQRVQCLYERAIARFPVTHVLWLQYAQYTEQHLAVPKVVNAVYARAVRNCPWVGVLWARGLRALERGGGSEEEHQAVYSAALSAGMESPDDYMEVSLARLDALRRRGPSQMEALRSAFYSTTELMQTYFPDHVDRSLRIPDYWARCEVDTAENHGNGRDVWEAALKTPLNMYAEAILAYVAFEVGEKRYKEARSIFKKFHRRSMHENGGVTVCEAWLRFEREHGSADDHFQAVIKTEPILFQAVAAATAAANPQAAAESKAAVQQVPKPELSKAEKKRLRQERDPNFKGAAQKQEMKAPGSSSSPAAPAERPMSAPAKRKTPGIGFDSKAESSKRRKPDKAALEGIPAFVSSGAHALTPEATALDDIHPGTVPQSIASTFIAEGSTPQPTPPNGIMGPPKPRPPLKVEADPQEQEKEHQQPGGDVPPETGPASKSLEAGSFRRKCYIKSISSHVTRPELRQMFEPCGQMVEFVMPEDRKMPPRHRGFAYITFSSQEGLQAALHLDGHEAGGQPLSVSLAHQEVQEGQREAFVLNIPPTADNAALEAFFATACGPIKSLRVPLDKDTSQLRGFAYVEFETSQGLQQAVDMTGIEFQGRNLKISISNQPIGGRAPMSGGRAPRARGGRAQGGQQRGGRATIELQGGTAANTFRPRSVARGRGAQGAKSNEEFRKLLK